MIYLISEEVSKEGCDIVCTDIYLFECDADEDLWTIWQAAHPNAWSFDDDIVYEHKHTIVLGSIRPLPPQDAMVMGKYLPLVKGNDLL